MMDSAAALLLYPFDAPLAPPRDTAETPPPLLAMESVALAAPVLAAEPLALCTTEERARIDEMFDLVADVVRQWRAEPRSSFEQAFAWVAAVHGHRYERLRRSGSINLGNVRRWRRAIGQVKGGLPDPDGRANLAPGYRRAAAMRKAKLMLPEPFRTRFFQGILNQSGLGTFKMWRLTCQSLAAEGVRDLPAYHDVVYYVKTRLLQSQLDRVQLRRKDYDQRHGGYALRRPDCEPGEVFIMDHRILDVWVRHPHPTRPSEYVAVRPWCTAVLDTASQVFLAVTIYVDSSPNHERILETLYKAILATGGRVPLKLIFDNGKDFRKKGAFRSVELQAAAVAAMETGQPAWSDTRSRRAAAGEEQDADSPFADVELQSHRHSVVRELGITVDYTAPYKGRQKSIERMFGDFSAEFDRLWPGYTGNCPKARPDAEYAGDVRRLITCQQLIDAFNPWLAGWHRRDNQSRIVRGRPRLEAWNDRPLTREPWSLERLQFAFLMPAPRTYTITHRGNARHVIHYHSWEYIAAGDPDCPEQYLRNADALYQHQGETVMIKTSWGAPRAELGSVTYPRFLLAFDLEGRYIATLEPADEVNMFQPTPAQRARLGKIQHILAHLRKRDSDAVREFLGMMRSAAKPGGPVRTSSPASALGLLGPGSGATGAIEGGDGPPPALPSGGGNTASASVLQEPGRVRTRRVQDVGLTAPDKPARPPVDPDLMLAFQRSLHRQEAPRPARGGQGVDSDLAAAVAASMRSARPT